MPKILIAGGGFGTTFLAYMAHLTGKERFRRHVVELLDSIRGEAKHPGRSPNPRFAKWARRSLRSTTKQFFKDSPSGAPDLESLHRFRSRGKRLRYVM